MPDSAASESSDPPTTAAADSAAQSAPVAKEEAAKQPPQPPPVGSLVDLLTAKGANARKLLSELAKGTSWTFDQQDVDAALTMLPEQDPHLTKTRHLLHEAIETKEGRFARTAGDFALRALGRELSHLPSWPAIDEVDPAIALQELTKRLEPELRAQTTQRRACNALMIGVDLLSDRRGLSVETAAPVLRATLGPPPAYARGTRRPRRHRVASLTQPRNDLEQLRDMLDMLQPWEVGIIDARKAEQQALAEARTTGDAAVSAERRVSDLLGEVEALRSELEDARQQAEASRARAQDVRIHAGADVTEIRSRSIAFLNTRLRDLLATAKEAAEVEPPRTATAVRLLEQAIQELRKEVEWLRSSA